MPESIQRYADILAENEVERRRDAALLVGTCAVMTGISAASIASMVHDVLGRVLS